MLSSCPQAAAPSVDFIRASLPVIERVATDVPPDERRRLRALARKLARNEPALVADIFGDRLVVGVARDCPAVVIADHSEISLFENRGDRALEYRILALAQRGDFTVIGCRRSVAFENYCSDTLGLGSLQVLALRASGDRPSTRSAKRCRDDDAAMTRLADAARRHGGLTVLPYMGTGDVWLLAADIASRAEMPIHVAAARPRLVRRVNDKIWFAARVREVLGRAASPPSYSAFGPAALAGRVAALARRHERVVVKLPDSASSSGNLVFSSDTLRGVPLAELRRNLLTLLDGLGWRGTYPLLAGIWDVPVLANPSVQLWIPHAGDRLPIVEGLFEQHVEGPRAQFVGASPSRLPAAWRQRIGEQAARLGYLFQQLGYFGRCSFDAVITGEDFDVAAIHWIECNGRWGGTSLPMTLANRLAADWPQRTFRTVQYPLEKDATPGFAEFVGRLEGKLLRIGDAAQGIAILSPGGIDLGTYLHLLIIAETEAQADAYCEAGLAAAR